MACRSTPATASLRAQLRGSRQPLRCPAAREHSAPRRVTRACAAPAAPPAPRRALLAGVAAAALLAGSPRGAQANPLDGLFEARRRTNAKYLLGPVRLARFYLAEAARLEPAEARKARARRCGRGAPAKLTRRAACVAQRVNKAAFDCLAIDSANLQAYNQLGRDVRWPLGAARETGVPCMRVCDARSLLRRCARIGSWPTA